MVINAVIADITKFDKVTAIVNAANNTLLGGGGVDGTIHAAAGPMLLKECRTLNGCATGEAKITGAYNLPCKYVIHTVGPDCRGNDNKNRAELLYNSYYNSLTLAKDKGIRKIAFPSIATGVYSYPLSEAAHVAATAVMDFCKKNPGSMDEIYWTLRDERTKKVYENEIASMSLV